MASAASEHGLLPAGQLASNGTNLLILLGWFVLLAWVFRITRSFYLLYRLNVAISTGQVVRLQTSDMSPIDREMLFGEMSMLWRTNMHQQLLRARRISCGIDVTQLQVPFVIQKTSVSVFSDESAQAATIGITCKYRSTERVALQVYWHVQASALSRLIASCNNQLLGPTGASVRVEGRRKKRLFGRGYVSVAQATDSQRNSFEREMVEMVAQGQQASPLDTYASVPSASSPLFTEAQACARSAVQQVAVCYGVSVSIVWCTCPMHTQKQRVRERERERERDTHTHTLKKKTHTHTHTTHTPPPRTHNTHTQHTHKHTHKHTHTNTHTHT
jgi:hypothetical protein